MPGQSNRTRSPVSPARTKSLATLFVCKRCSSGADLRRDIKAVVKATGLKRELRVVGCACLDVCPKRGCAAILTHARGPARAIVIDESAVGDDALIGLLLDREAGVVEP